MGARADAGRGRRAAPYGSWPSPVTAEHIAAGGLRLGGLALDGPRECWIEGRAAEGGRNVLVAHQDGRLADLSPVASNVRSRVHEYGGGAATVDGGEVWFVEFADQRIYRQPAPGSARPLTAEAALRYADLLVDRPRGRLICVVEDHRRITEGAREPENYLAAVDLRHGALTVLARGHDFYASPTLSPDGRALAWLAWDHPRMPWDGTELWRAGFGPGGELVAPTRVAGGRRESVFQPSWSPRGELYFVSDPGGWWNLYRTSGERVVPVYEGAFEVGRPQWVFGMHTYGFDGERVVAAYFRAGSWRLAGLRPGGAEPEEIPLPYDDIADVVVGEGRALLIAGAARRLPAVARLDLATGQVRELRRSAEIELPAAMVSEPRAVRFASSEGQHAHALHYPPRHSRYQGPDGELPPLIVIGHGGPTGAASRSLNPSIQFWTTRGFAVLDVDYRGSTGYGRAYREALYAQWGVRDVADCVHGARYLVDAGLADPERLAVRGGSAGGYTALAALTFHRTFTAGASYYGISDLEALARDTHKFESRYLEQLIGPYPEARARYRERSPVHHAARLACPVIFFQGLEDRVVPPNQAEMMVAALREKGLPVAYLAFAGEQHGFRAAATVQRTLEAELYFYGRIFGFRPADHLEPVAIEGLPPAS